MPELTQRMNEELELAFDDIAGDLERGVFEFGEDGVEEEDEGLCGMVYIRATEEYETRNFVIKVEITGGIPDGDTPAVSGEEGARW